MRDDNRTDLRVLQVQLHALRQGCPLRPIHVLAVDLGHLLTHQVLAAQRPLQAAYRLQQLGHTNLCRCIANVIAGLGRRASNGPTGAKNHKFFCHKSPIPLREK